MNLPSVTQALSPWQDFSRVPEDVLAAASERGRKVHGACAALALGLFVPPLEEELRGYVGSFRTWFDEAVEEVVLVEERLVCPELRYHGMPDQLVRIRGDQGLTIVDLKTPVTVAKAWALQCAAYRRLVEPKYPVRRNLSLRLRPDGTRALVNEYSGNYSHDLAVFLNALSVWRYFHGH